MKKFLLIGKSPQMRMVFLRDPESGLMRQHKIGQGVTIEITEDQMTDHVTRQAGYKILAVYEMDEEPEVIEEEEEPEVVEPEPPTVVWEDPVVEEPESSGVEVTEFDVEQPEEEETKPKKRRSRRKKAASE